MTTRESSGEAGLYATFAVTTLIVMSLAAALFRPRAAHPVERGVPLESVLLLDEPVEQR